MRVHVNVTVIDSPMQQSLRAGPQHEQYSDAISRMVRFVHLEDSNTTFADLAAQLESRFTRLYPRYQPPVVLSLQTDSFGDLDPEYRLSDFTKEKTEIYLVLERLSASSAGHVSEVYRESSTGRLGSSSGINHMLNSSFISPKSAISGSQQGLKVGNRPVSEGSVRANNGPEKNLRPQSSPQSSPVRELVKQTAGSLSGSTYLPRQGVNESSITLTPAVLKGHSNGSGAGVADTTAAAHSTPSGFPNAIKRRPSPDTVASSLPRKRTRIQGLDDTGAINRSAGPEVSVSNARGSAFLDRLHRRLKPGVTSKNAATSQPSPHAEVGAPLVHGELPSTPATSLPSSNSARDNQIEQTVAADAAEDMVGTSQIETAEVGNTGTPGASHQGQINSVPESPAISPTPSVIEILSGNTSEAETARADSAPENAEVDSWDSDDSDDDRRVSRRIVEPPKSARERVPTVKATKQGKTGPNTPIKHPNGVAISPSPSPAVLSTATASKELSPKKTAMSRIAVTSGSMSPRITSSRVPQPVRPLTNGDENVSTSIHGLKSLGSLGEPPPVQDRIPTVVPRPKEAESDGDLSQVSVAESDSSSGYSTSDLESDSESGSDNGSKMRRASRRRTAGPLSQLHSERSFSQI